MKSLKKTLSLVLVLVMVLGMFGIASASSFTDDTTIQYKEAVDVMVGIGAIAGFPDGTFGPTKTITRAEAAKMVAYTVLGKSLADSLTGVNSSFSDVPDSPAYSWAIPSIEYLVSIGVISGVGGGKFNPTGNVSALELGKMLLCALGYGAKDEYIGASWALQTAIDAQKYGIFAGRAANANALDKAATREEVALYCFNALGKESVEYSPLFAMYQKTGEALANPDSKADIDATIYPTLKRTLTSYDALGRPSVIWTNGAPATTISVAAARPFVSISAPMSGAAAALAIANAGYTFANNTVTPVPSAATNKTAVRFTTNGVTVTYDATEAATFLASASIGGNGVLMEVYGNTSGVVTDIVVVSTHFAPVTGYTPDIPATTTNDERTLTLTLNTFAVTANPKTPGFDAAYAAYTSALAAGLPLRLLVIPTNDATTHGVALSLAVAKSETVTPTSYVANKSFSVGSTTYQYSDNCHSTEYVAGFAPVTVYFDAYGYVIGTNAITSTIPQIAVVVNAGSQNDEWGNPSFKAELLMLDGTKQTVTTSANYGPAPAATNLVGQLVSYSISSNVYTLAATGTPVASSELKITTGVSAYTWGGGTKYANSQTIFITRTGAGNAASPYVYNVYAGIASVPNLSGTTVAGSIVGSATAPGIVYIMNPTTGTASSDLIFLPADSPVSSTTYPSGAVLHTYLAYVNGEVTTITLTAATVTPGVYTSRTVDAATGVSTLTSTVIAPASGDVTYAGGNIIYDSGNKQIAAASNCVVYVFKTSTGALTASNLGALNTITVTDYVLVPNATNSQAAAIFVYVA